MFFGTINLLIDFENTVLMLTLRFKCLIFVRRNLNLCLPVFVPGILGPNNSFDHKHNIDLK